MNYEADSARALKKAEKALDFGNTDRAYALLALANGYSALTASTAASRAIELAEL